MLLGKPGNCIYCGSAGANKHIIQDFASTKQLKIKSFSCGMCRRVLNGESFMFWADRVGAVRKGLLKASKPYYSFPNWGSDEIEELQGNLRGSVQFHLNKRREFEARFKYIDSMAFNEPISLFLEGLLKKMTYYEAESYLSYFQD